MRPARPPFVFPVLITLCSSFCAHHLLRRAAPYRLTTLPWFSKKPDLVSTTWYVGPSSKPPGKPAASEVISRPSEYTSCQLPPSRASRARSFAAVFASSAAAAASMRAARSRETVALVAGAPYGIAGMRSSSACTGAGSAARAGKCGGTVASSAPSSAWRRVASSATLSFIAICVKCDQLRLLAVRTGAVEAAGRRKADFTAKYLATGDCVGFGVEAARAHLVGDPISAAHRLHSPCNAPSRSHRTACRRERSAGSARCSL